MKVLTVSLLFAATVLLLACNSARTLEATPARLVSLDDAGRVELSSKLAELLHQNSVLIADDAFVANSILTLERKAHLDSQGNRIQGRELGMPDKVQLLLSEGHCTLKHLGNEKTIELTNLKCQPE